MSTQKIPQMVRDLYQRGLYDAAIELEQHLKTQPEYHSNYPGSVQTEIWLSKFLTKLDSLNDMKEDVRKIAPLSDPVLITGETGTGKELIARALHASRSGKFIPINCTSLPDYLLESELFGHAKGSFTGALNDKVGLFQEANRGTIFLDEIGDMPSVLQAKLLRVLQDMKIRRVGANNEIDIDCRVLCATNKNVAKLVETNKFREDLFQRISVFHIHLPPLRERGTEDLELIVTSLDTNHKFPVAQYIEGNPQLSGNIRDVQKAVRRWNVLGRLT